MNAAAEGEAEAPELHAGPGGARFRAFDCRGGCRRAITRNSGWLEAQFTQSALSPFHLVHRCSARPPANKFETGVHGAARQRVSVGHVG
eukprot:365329-Chlamydomonas_euryale.AAC.5